MSHLLGCSLDISIVQLLLQFEGFNPRLFLVECHTPSPSALLSKYVFHIPILP